MNKNTLLLLILIAGIFSFLSSCKKDLDHDLNYNPFDEDYVGPEAVSIIEFAPTYFAPYGRNILRIKIQHNTPVVKKSRKIVYRDGVYYYTMHLDTATVSIDYWSLPGETHNYQVQLEYNENKSKLSAPNYFTMY